MVFALNLYCFVILTYFAVFGFVTNSRVGRLLFLALAYKYCCILKTYLVYFKIELGLKLHFIFSIHINYTFTDVFLPYIFLAVWF